VITAPALTVDELVALLDQSIAEYEDREFEYWERVCIQHEHAWDGGLTLRERAIKALSEPDTPWGRHACARAVLREHSK
jgi:hypothetical protein